MPQVPVQKVEFDGHEDFARRLVAAFERLGLRRITAQILTSHAAISTNWGKAVDNYMLAGIKANASWRQTKPYTVLTGCECRPGLPDNRDPACVCPQGSGQEYRRTAWRAYQSLSEAAADFVRLLEVSRYKTAWAMAQAGDTEYFAEVGRAGWYTADTVKFKQHGERALREVQSYTGVVPVADSGPGLFGLAVAAAVVWWLLA